MHTTISVNEKLFQKLLMHKTENRQHLPNWTVFVGKMYNAYMKEEENDTKQCETNSAEAFGQ